MSKRTTHSREDEGTVLNDKWVRQSATKGLRLCDGVHRSLEGPDFEEHLTCAARQGVEGMVNKFGCGAFSLERDGQAE